MHLESRYQSNCSLAGRKQHISYSLRVDQTPENFIFQELIAFEGFQDQPPSRGWSGEK
jgi:hypothetical protein